MTKATDAMRAANTQHGHAMTGARRGEYQAWAGAKARCHNPNHSRYPRYGGRGIEMDPRWRDDFAAFLAGMGPKPSPKHSLDRIDNDKGYSPENCRWATLKEQARNHPPNKTGSPLGWAHIRQHSRGRRSDWWHSEMHQQRSSWPLPAPPRLFLEVRR